MNKKRIITFALAAVLILALGATAYAGYASVATPQAAEKVAREQVEVWKEMGLLSQDVTFEGPADAVRDGEKPGKAAVFVQALRHGDVGLAELALRIEDHTDLRIDPRLYEKRVFVVLVTLLELLDDLVISLFLELRIRRHSRSLKALREHIVDNDLLRKVIVEEDKTSKQSN